jgi:hypothetical protein
MPTHRDTCIAAESAQNGHTTEAVVVSGIPVYPESAPTTTSTVWPVRCLVL